MADSVFGFKVQIEGDEAVVRALLDMEKRINSLEKAQKSAARSAKTTAAATTVQSAVTKTATRDTAAYNRALAQGFNELTEMTFALGTAIPSMRGFGMAAASAGNSAFMLTTKMGPLGIGLGLVIGLLPQLVGLLVDSGDAAEEAARGTGEWSDSLDEVVNRIEAAIEAQDRYQRILAGSGGIVETQAALGMVVDRSREFLEDFEDELDRVQHRTGATDERMREFARALRETGGDAEEARRLFTELRQELQAKHFNIDALIDVTGKLNLAEEERLRITRAMETALMAENEQLRAKRDAMQQILDIETEQEEKRKRLAREEQAKRGTRPEGRGRGRGAREETQEQRIRKDIELQQLLSSVRSEASVEELMRQENERIGREENIDLLARETEAYQKASAARKDMDQKQAANTEELQRIQELNTRGAEAAVRYTSDLLQVAAEGDRAALASFLEATAKRNLILAAERTAIGVFNTFFNPPLAAAAFEAAALHASVAGLAGVSAAAAGAGGAFQSRRGNRSNRPQDPEGLTGRGVPPSSSAGRPMGQEGAGTVVINFNSPVNEADLGRLNDRARRAAIRRGKISF